LQDVGISRRRSRRFPFDGQCLLEANPVLTNDKTSTDDEAGLARLIVATLNLDVTAEEIDPNTPLYGEGLGLDSIDMLEIALVVSQQYGVKLRADDENNTEIFSSLRSLNAFIQAHRAA
jgi:acyl carrier protein